MARVEWCWQNADGEVDNQMLEKMMLNDVRQMLTYVDLSPTLQPNAPKSANRITMISLITGMQ